MIPTDRHGFTIAQTFVSPVSNRVVGSPQGVEVTHPAFPTTSPTAIHQPAPLGWHKSRRAALEQIEELHRRAHGHLVMEEALAHSEDHWQRLAQFWPEAPNPPVVLTRMEELGVEQEQRVEAERLLRAQADRYVRFGPDLVAALERLIPDAITASAGYESTPVVAARTLLRKVRGEVTADGRVA
jgi:hypothetical protein